MFDLGLQELIVIFVVALLVFGPKKLPDLSKTLGRGIRELRTALHGVKESMAEASDETQRVGKDLSKEISESIYAAASQEEAMPGEKEGQKSESGGQKPETVKPEENKEKTADDSHG
ncbi:MAG: twin-arginine translocase TatA/TatE family subunit [Nitrospirae bacterium]|nr:twin-arginine translocase TatA/TatE family subunit [Nitrospirota bacterium]